jgi:hypothetical protein
MQFGFICGKLLMLTGRGVVGATYWVLKQANVNPEATYDQSFLNSSNCRSTKYFYTLLLAT